MRAPDEEQAAGDLDGSEPTSKVAVDDILYDRWESRNRSWNRLSTRTVHCRSIEPSHVIREPGASDEQTTDPSEDERQMAKVGSEDTCDPCGDSDPYGSNDSWRDSSNLGSCNSPDSRPRGEVSLWSDGRQSYGNAFCGRAISMIGGW